MELHESFWEVCRLWEIRVIQRLMLGTYEGVDAPPSLQPVIQPGRPKSCSSSCGGAYSATCQFRVSSIQHKGCRKSLQSNMEYEGCMLSVQRLLRIPHSSKAWPLLLILFLYQKTVRLKWQMQDKHDCGRDSRPAVNIYKACNTKYSSLLLVWDSTSTRAAKSR